jgi:hypothetical protein
MLSKTIKEYFVVNDQACFTIKVTLSRLFKNVALIYSENESNNKYSKAQGHAMLHI